MRCKREEAPIKTHYIIPSAVAISKAHTLRFYGVGTPSVSAKPIPGSDHARHCQHRSNPSANSQTHALTGIAD